jgi:CelD/BcsL family acetyltransferase involved in cellulose biosynthesis
MLHADAGQFARQSVTVDVAEGFPAVLDVLADRAGAGRGFQRAAWYAGDADARAQTVIATRADGSPVAAIPSIPVGPSLVGARAVPGSYWPFRSIAIDATATEQELKALLAHPSARAALFPLWRVGPIYRDDRATRMLKRAAGQAGWTVLTRPLGKTFLFNLAAMSEGNAWPRKSTRRRLANYEKQLAEHGAVRVRHVTGTDWDEAAFAALAPIEANSWVGTGTDGSGAKFLSETQRERWRRAVRDPVLAEALSATLLYVGDVPAAFSFDLRDGAMQYAIAGSYDERFAAWRAGKIVTYHQLDWARRRGVATV